MTVNATAPKLGLRWFWQLLPLWSVLLGIMVGALAVLVTGQNPLRAAAVILEGAFGSPYVAGATLVKAAPLLLCGLSVALAFRAGLFNIGAEGQLQVGAVAAAAVALSLKGAPGIVVVPLALVAAFVAGGLWGGVAGLLKAVLGWHEIVTTVMFNYLGLLLVSLLVNGPLLAPGEDFPQSERIAAAAELPMWVPGTRLHAGFFLAMGLAALLWFLITRSTWGFQLRVVGENPNVARHAGISVPRTMVGAMFAAGGLAGLAGAGEVLGVYFRLLDGFSPGFGYLGIAVAFLAAGHPLGVIPVAIFFGATMTGASYLQRVLQVPGSIMYIIQSVPVLFLASTETLRRQKLAAAPPPAAPPAAAPTKGVPESA